MCLNVTIVHVLMEQYVSSYLVPTHVHVQQDTRANIVTKVNSNLSFSFIEKMFTGNILVKQNVQQRHSKSYSIGQSSVNIILSRYINQNT